jgi:hypothetical protein
MHKINMISVTAFVFGIEVIADHIGGRADPPRWRQGAVKPSMIEGPTSMVKSASTGADVNRRHSPTAAATRDRGGSTIEC